MRAVVLTGLVATILAGLAWFAIREAPPPAPTPHASPPPGTDEAGSRPAPPRRERVRLPPRDPPPRAAPAPAAEDGESATPQTVPAPAPTALLRGFEDDAERAAVTRHLARFGRGAGPPQEDERTWLDARLERVAAREWATRAVPLAVADPDAAEERRIAQLERLRDRGVTSLLERIAAGLAWLALHQADDGSVSDAPLRCARLHAQGEICGRGRRRTGRTLAATALATLAFLDFRDQDARGLFEPSLARAVTWLRRRQRADGGFGHEGYDVALALLALGQATAASGDAELGATVERAWASYLRTAGPRGGFRYVAGQDGDLSVTAWVVQAYEASRAAGLAAPSPAAVESLRYFVHAVRDERDGFAYMAGQRPRASLQSAGMLALHVLGEAEDDAVRERFARTLRTSATPVSGVRVVNLYRLYYDVRMELLLADDLTPARRDLVLFFAQSFQHVDGFQAGLFDTEPRAFAAGGSGVLPAGLREQWVTRGGLEAFHAFSVLTLEHTLFRR